MAAAIGQGPQVAQGEDHVKIKLHKANNQNKNVLGEKRKSTGSSPNLLKQATVEESGNNGNGNIEFVDLGGDKLSKQSVDRLTENGSKHHQTPWANVDSSLAAGSSSKSPVPQEPCGSQGSSTGCIGVVDSRQEQLNRSVSSSESIKLAGSTQILSSVTVPSSGFASSLVPSLQIQNGAVVPPQYPNGPASYASYSYFQQQQSISSPSSLEKTFAAAGTMIGNIAKGLLEGANPIINNLMLMHKVRTFDMYN